MPWSLWWLKLIISQVKGEYKVRHEDLIHCHHAAIKLADSFDGFYISHMSHLLNTKADALATLAATLALPADTTYCLTVATHHLFCPKYSLEVSEVHKTSTNFEPRDWRFLIIDLRFAWHTARWSQGSGFCSTKIYLILLRCSGEDVYRRSYDGILLHCLSSSKAREVLKEAHDGICRAHQSGPKFKDRLHRLGYYWPTMITDAIEYARRCKDCQIHANFIRQPPELLHPTVASLANWSMGNWHRRTHQSFIDKRSSAHSCDNRLLLKMSKSCIVPWS